MGSAIITLDNRDPQLSDLRYVVRRCTTCVHLPPVLRGHYIECVRSTHDVTDG